MKENLKVILKLLHFDFPILIYLSNFLQFKMPIKKSGKLVIDGVWCIHYDILSTNEIDFEKELIDVVNTHRYLIDRKSEIKKSDPDSTLALNGAIADMYKSLTSLRYLDNNIHFKKFHLQDYSEYVMENRNIKIDKLFN